MPTRISFTTHFPDRMGELAGQPTYFQEKIWSGLQYTNPRESTVLYSHYRSECRKITGSDWPNEWPNILWQYPPKTTTIRSNYDYWKSKEGQLVQPFFWAGKPYHSKQVVFCPEVRLKRVSKVEIRHYEPNENANTSMWVMYDIHKYGTLKLWDRFLDREKIKLFTQHEGFDHPDHFWMWFDKDYYGAYLELESAKI